MSNSDVDGAGGSGERQVRQVFKLVDKKNVGSINFDQFNQLMTMVSDPAPWR